MGSHSQVLSREVTWLDILFQVDYSIGCPEDRFRSIRLVLEEPMQETITAVQESQEWPQTRRKTWTRRILRSKDEKIQEERGKSIESNGFI